MPLMEHTIQQSVSQTENSLDLSFCQINDEDIPLICNFLLDNDHIYRLNLSLNNIIDDGVKQISQLPSLTSLNLANNKIGPAGAATLAKTNNLKTVILSNNSIGPSGAKALVSNKIIQHLDVGANNITTEGAITLALNESIISLSVWNNNILEQGAIALAASKTITSLNIGDNDIGLLGAKVLISNRRVTSLNIEFTNLGSKGAKNFIDTQKNNTTLIKLDHGFQDRSNILIIDRILEKNKVLGLKRLLQNLNWTESTSLYEFDSLNIHSDAVLANLSAHLNSLVSKIEV